MQDFPIVLVPKKDLAKAIYKASRITGEFVLRSGAISNVYFDKYLFEADPRLLAAIAYHMTDLLPTDTDRLVGLEMGGIPLVTALSLRTHLSAGFCRKKPKEYGTRLQVEGGVESGERVVLIEDVITSGGAVVGAIEALRALSVDILGLICVLDRESGGATKLQELGVKFWPLFTWTELEQLATGSTT